MCAHCSAEHRVRQLFHFFCNRQQHNYFVLLFVSFCTEKKGKQKGRVDVFNVFLVAGSLGSNRNSIFAESSCTGAESGAGTLLRRSE